MDPMKANSVRVQKQLKQNQKQYTRKQDVFRLCQKWDFQNYENAYTNKKTYLKNMCAIDQTCQKQQCQYEKAFVRAQNLLTQYRRNPQNYPVLPITYSNSINPYFKRQYSNMWYRRIGTSNGMGSVMNGYPYSSNSSWPAVALTGSNVPYTDGFNNVF